MRRVIRRAALTACAMSGNTDPTGDAIPWAAFEAILKYALAVCSVSRERDAVGVLHDENEGAVVGEACVVEAGDQLMPELSYGGRRVADVVFLVGE